MQGIYIGPLDKQPLLNADVSFSRRRDESDNKLYGRLKYFGSLWGTVTIIEYVSAILTFGVFSWYFWEVDLRKPLDVQTWGPLAVLKSAHNVTTPEDTCKFGNCPEAVSFDYFGNETFAVTAIPAGKISLHGLVISIQWLSLLAQLLRGMYLSGVFSGGVKQAIDGPDWSRWIEYAITSPLMVLLIALSWLAAEVETLILLAIAQFACVVLGQIIEERLQGILTGQIKRSEKQSAWWFFAQQVEIWAFVSWTLFFAVWVTLIARVDRLDSFVKACLKNDDASCNLPKLEDEKPLPDNAMVLVFLVGALFLTFGIWNCVMLIWAYFWYVRPEKQFETEAARRYFWSCNALGYSILSISSKLALQISFLYYALSLQNCMGKTIAECRA